MQAVKSKIVTRIQTCWRFGLILLLGVASGHAQIATTNSVSHAAATARLSSVSFAIDLYHIIRETQENLVFSPYAISEMAALISHGAKGTSRAELVQALHFPTNHATLQHDRAELNDHLTKLGKRGAVVLQRVESLWLDNSFPLAAGFADVAKRQYLSDVIQTDFTRNPKAALDKINVWANQKGVGNGDVTLGSEGISERTRLVLLNAVAFEGKWLNPFDVKKTIQEPFMTHPARTSNVPMMHLTARAKLSSVDGADLVEMYYVGKGVSMVIILPRAAYGLTKIEARMSAENLQSWLAKLNLAAPVECDITLPRFGLRVALDLKKTLQKLGVSSIFNPSAADLSGISTGGGLFVSGAWQDTLLRVHEAGTSVRTETAVHFESISDSEEFCANHPFIFLVRENLTGCILFLGKVVDPSVGAESTAGSTQK